MKKIAILATTAALVFAGSTAAMAADLNVDGTNWSTSTYAFGINQVSNQWDIANRAGLKPYGLDSTSFRVSEHAAQNYNNLNCDVESSITTDSDGSMTVGCDTPASPINGITWTGNIKVFSGVYQGLVGRSTYTVTNIDEVERNLDFNYYVDTEECNGNSGSAGNVATSSGDLDATNADHWLLCNNDNQALEGIIWGDHFATAVDGNDGPTASDEWGFTNDDGTILQPGESKTFVFFYYSVGALDHGNDAGLTDAAAGTYMVDNFTPAALKASALWDGVTEAYNWEAPAASTPKAKKKLANTGSTTNDALATLGLAVLGAGVAAIRRARSAR